jgi:hypothetical protein
MHKKYLTMIIIFCLIIGFFLIIKKDCQNPDLNKCNNKIVYLDGQINPDILEQRKLHTNLIYKHQYYFIIESEKNTELILNLISKKPIDNFENIRIKGILKITEIECNEYNIGAKCPYKDYTVKVLKIEEKKED